MVCCLFCQLLHASSYFAAMHHVQSHQRLCCHPSPNQRIQARTLGNELRDTSIASGRNVIAAAHRQAWMTQLQMQAAIPVSIALKLPGAV